VLLDETNSNFYEVGLDKLIKIWKTLSGRNDHKQGIPGQSEIDPEQEII